MQIVDEKAQSSHPLHLFEQSNGVVSVEVVKDEGRMDDVEGIVFVRRGQGISDVYPDPRSERGGKMAVQMVASAVDSDGIEVESHRVHRTIEVTPSPDEPEQVVASSTAQVEDLYSVSPPQNGIQNGVRGRMPPE